MGFISLGELTKHVAAMKACSYRGYPESVLKHRASRQPRQSRDPKILTLGPCTSLTEEQSRRAEPGCRTGTASFSRKDMI
jgi:hypothetical protein